MLCTACGKWVHARCADSRKVTVGLAEDFVCKKCEGVIENLKGPDELLCDGVETATKFSHLGDKLHASGCKTALTARTRIGYR